MKRNLWDIEMIAKIEQGRQDGAILNGYLFSFNHNGRCVVYETKQFQNLERSTAKVFSEFVLDRCEGITPHSNSVAFGNEFFSADDEFPLLYTNIYNNYANSDCNMKGVCLVYRLQRNGSNFFSTLVQIIEIGFTEDENYWKSSKEDVRPYGNFTIDRENGIFYAFTMRDSYNTTRYFAFDLPKVETGAMCEKYNVKKVTLNISDIRDFFDCEYQNFVQGACCHDGKIYSLEGFSDDVSNPPAMRIIDTRLKKELALINFSDFGLNDEPEMIEFENDICYYADHNGNVYNLHPNCSLIAE